MILAHGDTVSILTFWSLFCGSLVASSTSLVVLLIGPKKRWWNLLCGVLSSSIGLWVAYAAALDGALRNTGWFSVIAFVPLLMGVAAVLAWLLRTT